MTAGDARAQAMPQGIEELLREANGAERGTIENVAKRLYPDEHDRIDDVIDAIEDEEEAAVDRASFASGWTGHVSAGANWSNGNTERWEVSLGIDVKRKSSDFEHRVIGYLDIASQDGDRTMERVGLTYRLRHDFDDTPWFAAAYLSYERDRFQSIQRRFTEMAGVGYQLVDSDDVDLEISFGPALRQTRYLDRSDRHRLALASAADFTYDISDTLKLTERAGAVIDEGNSSFTTVTALTSNLYGRLSGRVSFTADYESNPSAGAKKLDTRGQVGLSLEM